MIELVDHRSTRLVFRLPGGSEFLANMSDPSHRERICFQEDKPKGQCSEMPALFKIIFSSRDNLGGYEGIYLIPFQPNDSEFIRLVFKPHTGGFQAILNILILMLQLIEHLIAHLEATLLPNCPPASELVEDGSRRRRAQESYLFAL